MQILGKRSKVLLIVVAITMLVAIGMSFAMWDNMSTVKATNGDLSNYANAKVGDIVEFGRYYQTGNRINNDENAEYEKTPIEWIIVDKDERTGQLTLMSKYILACGSYFGNYYYNLVGDWGAHYNTSLTEVDGNTSNQAYIESTARAFLNNLERRDLGGDTYDGGVHIISKKSSDKTTGKLLTSIGFSDRKYYTNNGSFQRPINKSEYKNRPATRGFYDEAFSLAEKAMIAPKAIAGYTGYRWPNETNGVAEMSYVEGCIDKVWLPSATELNIVNVEDNNTNPSDASSSTVFEYFKDKTGVSLQNLLKSERTKFARDNSKAMNYSIPVYEYQSTIVNDDIHTTDNSLDYYWTRSPSSDYCSRVRYVSSAGSFHNYTNTYDSYIGIRPCIVLKY